MDAAPDALRSALDALEQKPAQGADKSALQAAIDEAKALNAADYTEASWSNLAQALAEAETICADESADQARVDAAKDALRSALDALEQKPAQGADKSALQAAIDAAKALNAADYTESSWAAVAEALEAANSVNGDAEATQDKVDAAAKALNDAMNALEKLPVRTNNASLPGEFSGEQGKNGWYYGACDWDGNNFEELSYNGSAYVGSDGLELKADFIHPAPFRNAAYKWVAAQDGQIRVTGTYVKFANSADPAANGVAFRIRHLTDDRFKGLTEQYAEDYTCSFDETFTVKAGDPIIFQVDAEGGNNSYDGGKLTVTIVPIS